jgi:hypothetical protein
VAESTVQSWVDRLAQALTADQNVS